jgi:hypothetical protein
MLESMPISHIINQITTHGYLNFENEMMAIWNMAVNLKKILLLKPSAQSDIKMYNAIIE